MKEICRQNKDLVRVTAQEAPLLLQLSRSMATRHVFSKSWDPCGYQFRELLLFSAGLATLMPTMSLLVSNADEVFVLAENLLHKLVSKC